MKWNASTIRIKLNRVPFIVSRGTASNVKYFYDSPKRLHIDVSTNLSENSLSPSSQLDSLPAETSSGGNTGGRPLLTCFTAEDFGARETFRWKYLKILTR